MELCLDQWEHGEIHMVMTQGKMLASFSLYQ